MLDWSFVAEASVQDKGWSRLKVCSSLAAVFRDKATFYSPYGLG
jgi:hypothetical protein